MPSRYNLTTADDSSCVRGNRFTAARAVSVQGPGGDVVAVSGAGAPLQLEVASGPMTVAGIAKLKGTVTAAGLDGRAFLGLAVGSTPADARVVANNLIPMRRALPVSGEAFELELTGVSVVVPEGQHLYLTIAPMSDLFFGHGSKAPTGWVLSDLQLTLPGLAK